MAVPSGFRVRVAHAVDNLPYPVNVILPATLEAGGTNAPPAPRTVGPDLDIIVPDNSKGFEALGRFMTEWSLLETTTTVLIAKVVITGRRVARAIASNTMMRGQLDFLTQCGTLTVDPLDRQSFQAVIRRLKKMNRTRNVIVHGSWVLEANVGVRNKEAVIETRFVRESTPPDRQLAKLIGDPRQQAERAKYVYTVPRIIEAAAHCAQLNTDTSALANIVRVQDADLEP